MAGKHKVTVSVDSPKHRLTSTERRAAVTAAIATKQQDLKREAAERRAKRARDDAMNGHAPTSVSRKAASPRRSSYR